MVTTQLPAPLQAPLHPEKTALEAGAADNETTVPLLKPALQVAPQLIPAGVLVTVPLPVPVFATISEGVNVAVTAFAAFIVTAQIPVPEQAPLQPEKV